MKQYSPSFECNAQPIGDVLAAILPTEAHVVELGCGSGQHAVAMSQRRADVQWQPTDRDGQLESAVAWCAEASCANLCLPAAFDLLHDPWCWGPVDALIAINVVHIAPMEAAVRLFSLAGAHLRPGGLLYLYGAMRYGGRQLESSNEDFDAWLRARDPQSGLRVFEDLDRLAREAGLVLAEDRAMPSNNRSIWWRKE